MDPGKDLGMVLKVAVVGSHESRGSERYVYTCVHGSINHTESGSNSSYFGR